MHKSEIFPQTPDVLYICFFFYYGPFDESEKHQKYRLHLLISIQFTDKMIFVFAC